MVETIEQLNNAQSYEHLKDAEFISIGNTFFRICAPEVEDNQMHSCIFWTKNTLEDNEPTWQKVVRA